jgi:hypothetical protein
MLDLRLATTFASAMLDQKAATSLASSMADQKPAETLEGPPPTALPCRAEGGEPLVIKTKEVRDQKFICQLASYYQGYTRSSLSKRSCQFLDSD